jgi:cation transport regulator
MPYSTIGELPDGTKGLPAHAKEIYMKAFNAAFEQYKDRGNQREALSHGTAWAAVKKVYKQVDGKWVSKSKEASMVTKLSDKNKRNLLQTALVSEYGLQVDDPIPKKVSVEEVFDDKIVYSVDGRLYEASYQLDEKGIAVFGEPKEVTETRIYRPMESLQPVYSELIQEVGKRNAAMDATRVKKILELCQELLSSEDEPEEKKAKEALKEATAVLALIKEQAVVKTEDGIKFPAAAYAYVPDAEKSSDWKLRIWEDLEKKITRSQLGRAAAALSPGGFRGQKVAIPSADLPTVKRKIRAEYRKLDVEDEDIPRWVREVETRERILNVVPLSEAKFDKGRATVVVIKAGFNATEDRYYPAEVLKRDFGIFEGMKMYADHPTEEEDKARPERSIRDWVATLSEVTCDENAIVTGVAEIIEPWLMQKLASLREKDMLSEMGISINAIGSASKGTVDGKETLVIEKLVAAKSVDFVTEPGAGGVVTLYEADRNHDIDLVELAALKEKRPDLIKAIEAAVRMEITKEVKKAMENEERIKDLEGQITELTTERDNLKEAAEKAEKDKAKAEAQATIKEAVDKAELPDAAKERLIERFKDAESAEGIEEAIQSEVDYIAKLAEAGKVKGLGPSKQDPEKDREALRESVKKAYPEWTDDEVETFVTGR